MTLIGAQDLKKSPSCQDGGMQTSGKQLLLNLSASGYSGPAITSPPSGNSNPGQRVTR